MGFEALECSDQKLIDSLKSIETEIQAALVQLESRVSEAAVSGLPGSQEARLQRVYH